ncbi:MAG: YdbL family protein [Candidatus Omnitrophica bacterium]|nr:YdbL family protein [Candidatus Omnitrophota bacterium]
MKKMFLFLCVIFIFGCASVAVKAPKEPIKIDITMRLDIYQHVQKDINMIEDMISGGSSKTDKIKNETKSSFFLGVAFAEEEFLTPEVAEAVSRRRSRTEQLNSLKREGIIGENRLGLLVIRETGKADNNLGNLIKDEINDRMIIYKAIANKNNISIEEVQKLYSGRLQKDSPSGTPIEIFNASKGSYEWSIK